MIYDPLIVLLMEDTRDDERLALRALRTCGLPLCVWVARDGEQAMRALGIEGSPEERLDRVPDLVISDLKMPKYSGDEVLRRARADARLRDVPYVMFSSSDDGADVLRCLEMGATAYCVKPVGYDEYVQCTGLIARRWLSGNVAAQEPFCVVASSNGNPAPPSGVR